MRKLAVIPMALLALVAASPDPPAPGDALIASTPFSADRSVRTLDREGCVSIPRQVAGENRRLPGTRLDQQPEGRLLYAVQREMDGCPEVVLVNDQQLPAGAAFPDRPTPAIRR